MRKGSIVFAGLLAAYLLAGCASDNTASERASVSGAGIRTEETAPDKEGSFVTDHAVYTQTEKGIEQRDFDGKLLRTITYEDIGEESEFGILVTLLAVNPDEILYGNTEDDLCSIPLRRTEEGEIPLPEKHEVLVSSKEREEIDLDNALYVDKNYILYFSFDGRFHVRNRRDNENNVKAGNYEMSCDGENKFTCVGVRADWERDKEGDFVLLEGYKKDVQQKKPLYVHRIGSRETEKIADNFTAMSLADSGNGAFFYTGLLEGQEGGVSCDVWSYQCQAGEKKVLIRENEIREMLGAGENESCFVRRLSVRGDELWLDVMAGGRSRGLRYSLKDSGGLREDDAVFATEREADAGQKIQPIKDGDSKYSYCNDYMIYIETENGIEQRGLDGAYIRTIALKEGTLLYVNNEELIIQRYPGSYATAVLYTIPISREGDGEMPQVWKMEKITKVGADDEDLYAFNGCLYADERYLAYITCNHEFTVYDRSDKKFIKIKNAPETGHSIGGSMLDNKCGDCIIFKTKPVKEGKKRNVYGFSIYRLGEDRVEIIDENCYTAAPVLYYREGNKIFYGVQQSYDIWVYDAETGKKRVFIRGNDIKKAYKENKINFSGEDGTYFGGSIFTYGGRLYLMAEEAVFSCSPEDNSPVLQYEEKMTETLKENGVADYDIITIAEGKCLARYYEEGEGDAEEEDWEEEEDEPELYGYYDMESGVFHQITEDDPEMLYFKLTAE